MDFYSVPKDYFQTFRDMAARSQFIACWLGHKVEFQITQPFVSRVQGHPRRKFFLMIHNYNEIDKPPNYMIVLNEHSYRELFT